jgi:phage terminase large subunit-like protein
MRSFLERIQTVWSPHAGQLDFLLSTTKTRILACGRRWGKTEACAAKIVACLHQQSAGRHLLVAPTLEQAKILFRRVGQMLDRFQGILGSPTRRSKQTPFPQLEFADHIVTARSGHTPDALRGDEATHIIVDEAAFVPESLVTEVLWPMLATNGGEMTLISSPNGFNWFWRLFQAARIGDPNLWSRAAPSTENPRVSPSFLAMQRGLLSERAYAVEYEAEFREETGALIPANLLESARTEDLSAAHGEVVIGVDWAQTRDYTAVAVLQGERRECWLREIERIPRGEYRDMVDHVAAIAERYPGSRIHHDATGVGQVADELLRARLPHRRIVAINFTVESKSRLVEHLVSAFERRALWMRPDPALELELRQYVATRTDTGHVRYAAKGGGHDDLVTALMLALSALRTGPTAIYV